MNGKIKPGVYETVYGNAAAWDGRYCLDLDMMDLIPVALLDTDPLLKLRDLEDDDRTFIEIMRENS